MIEGSTRGRQLLPWLYRLTARSSPSVPGDMMATKVAYSSTAIRDDAMVPVPHTEVSVW
jgi:hypothetical protein